MSISKEAATEALARVIFAREARENDLPMTWETAPDLARATSIDEATEYLAAVDVMGYVGADLSDAFALLSKYDDLETASERISLGHGLLIEIQTRTNLSIAQSLARIAEAMRRG